MALLEIKKFGCPTLKKPCELISEVDEEVRSLVTTMFETMYANEGIGLAAPQVGVSRRILVLDVRPSDPTKEPRAFINPTIVSMKGEIVGEEGCLSLPGVTGEVKRAEEIRVEAGDETGAPFSFEALGIEARALQHEIDHLDGTLVVEKFSVIRRNILRSQLRRLKKEGGRQASEPVEMEAMVRESAT